MFSPSWRTRRTAPLTIEELRERTTELLEFNLVPSEFLDAFVRTEQECVRAQDYLFQRVWFEDDFWIALAERAVTDSFGEPETLAELRNRSLLVPLLEYLKHTWAQLSADGRRWCHISGLCVVAVRRDIPKWIAAFAAGNTVPDLVKIAPITATHSRLYRVKWRDSAATEVMYFPRNEDDAREYVYTVYLDPSRPSNSWPTFQALPPHSAILKLARDGPSLLRGRAGVSHTADCYPVVQPGQLVLNTGMSELYSRHAFLAEQQLNIGDAEHLRAHDRAVFARKPLPDVPAHLLSPEKLQQTRTTTEASAVTRLETTAITSAFTELSMRARLADLKLPRQQRNPEDTVRLNLRQLYDRPSQVDDALLLDEDWEVAHMPVPSTTLNLMELRESYVDEVARMWGIPLIDMTGGRRGAGGSTGSAPSLVAEERRDLIRRERRACADLIAFFYRQSLASVDLLHLSHALETFDDKMMEHVARTLGERRALLKDAVEAKAGGGSKKRKREPNTETSDDDAGGGGKRARTATVGELKQTIRERVLEQQSLEAYLIFAADLAREETLGRLRDHDALDPEIRKARLQEAEVLLKTAELGVASLDSVRRGIQELLGAKLTAASTTKPYVPAAQPASPTAAAPKKKKK